MDFQGRENYETFERLFGFNIYISMQEEILNKKLNLEIFEKILITVFYSVLFVSIFGP